MSLKLEQALRSAIYVKDNFNNPENASAVNTELDLVIGYLETQFLRVQNLTLKEEA
jgi:IMP cyclohydrolase